MRGTSILVTMNKRSFFAWRAVNDRGEDVFADSTVGIYRLETLPRVVQNLMTASARELSMIARLRVGGRLPFEATRRHRI